MSCDGNVRALLMENDNLSINVYDSYCLMFMIAFLGICDSWYISHLTWIRQQATQVPVCKNNKKNGFIWFIW